MPENQYKQACRRFRRIEEDFPGAFGTADKPVFQHILPVRRPFLPDGFTGRAPSVFPISSHHIALICLLFLPAGMGEALRRPVNSFFPSLKFLFSSQEYLQVSRSASFQFSGSPSPSVFFDWPLSNGQVSHTGRFCTFINNPFRLNNHGSGSSPLTSFCLAGRCWAFPPLFNTFLIAFVGVHGSVKLIRFQLPRCLEPFMPTIVFFPRLPFLLLGVHSCKPRQAN